MSRNDGYLYSGINSVTRDRKSVRERIKENKQEAQQRLTPAAEIIFGRIETEKAALGELLAGLVDSKQSATEVQKHIGSIKLYRDFLLRLELQFKADLRQGRVSELEASDE